MGSQGLFLYWGCGLGLKGICRPHGLVAKALHDTVVAQTWHCLGPMLPRPSSPMALSLPPCPP